MAIAAEGCLQKLVVYLWFRHVTRMHPNLSRSISVTAVNVLVPGGSRRAESSLQSATPLKLAVSKVPDGDSFSCA